MYAVEVAQGEKEDENPLKIPMRKEVARFNQMRLTAKCLHNADLVEWFDGKNENAY